MLLINFAIFTVMSTHILTLFGEEVVPEKLPTTRKKTARKKKKKETVVEVQPIAADSEVLKDWEGEKNYYTIGEVSKLFNVRTSNIRYWTKEFGLKVRTTRKGDRLYTPDRIKEIRTIYHLVKERGYTISGAKAKLKESKNMTAGTIDLKDSLLQLRKKLVDLKDSL